MHARGYKSLDAIRVGDHAGPRGGPNTRVGREFRAIAEPLYRRDPVTNTIELTLLRADRFGDDALLLSVWDDGNASRSGTADATISVGVQRDTDAKCTSVVATELARTRPGLAGVRGERDMALAFADAWHAATGLAGTVATEERLYRLGMLQPPAGVCGAHREAADADRALLVDWVEHFFVETFSHQRDDAAGRRFIDNANAVGDRFVLWNDDGSPVSMAMLRAPSAGVSRIGPVFTPARLARTRLRLCGDGRGGAAGAPMAASMTSCCSRIWPTRRPTPFISASASTPSQTRSGSSSR